MTRIWLQTALNTNISTELPIQKNPYNNEMVVKNWVFSLKYQPFTIEN